MIWPVHDHGERAAGMSADGAAGGGDVAGAGPPVEADRQVAQGRHDGRSVTGPDLGEVLGEGHAPHPVQPVLDAPMRSQRVRELGGAGLLDGGPFLGELLRGGVGRGLAVRSCPSWPAVGERRERGRRLIRGWWATRTPPLPTRTDSVVTSVAAARSSGRSATNAACRWCSANQTRCRPARSAVAARSRFARRASSTLWPAARGDWSSRESLMSPPAGAPSRARSGSRP